MCRKKVIDDFGRLNKDDKDDKDDIFCFSNRFLHLSSAFNIIRACFNVE